MSLWVWLQTTVYVQVVFMKLGEIDTIKETFSADVFIKTRWREPRLDGSETAKKKVRIDYSCYKRLEYFELDSDVQNR